MKTVLCISPHFPPVNAADMHRVRQGLHYFEQYGWRPVIFTVNPMFVEASQDSLLKESIPEDIEIHEVNALDVAWTRKLGLGNLGFRSYFQFRKYVSEYLKKNHVDLIYFSTTVFTLMVLGRYWKRRFNVPFVIDLQDPWRNDYYLGLPEKERPSKFWFDYRQKKILEARTMPHADGVIAVSEGYIHTIKKRYPVLSDLPCLTLPFGALKSDFDIAGKLPAKQKSKFTEIVYVGRGGSDMKFALSVLFCAIAQGLKSNAEVFSKIRLRFVGTSYAADGKGRKSVMPLAEEFGVGSLVEEVTDRLPYFQALRALMDADVLFIPGSDDKDYTASKIYPYILADKPMLAIFNVNSNVVNLFEECNVSELVTFDASDSLIEVADRVRGSLELVLNDLIAKSDIDWEAFEAYSAREMTRRQCEFFDLVTLSRPSTQC
jgi:hypothetical protein